MSDRTFKLTSPLLMSGSDVRAWQESIVHEFARMDIKAPVVIDGIYGGDTRSFTKSLCHALGMNAAQVMEHGVTPELRTRIRNRLLSADEAKRRDDRIDWRRRLRTRYAQMDLAKVSMLVGRVITDANDYSPPGHDGIDLITYPDVPVFAPVRARVIDVRASGWWGKGAPSDPAIKAKGDGIIQLEILETVGPFRKGHHLGYGHAEKAVVRVGQIVQSGDKIGHSGFANAWHIHFMLNDGSTSKGIGNRDPQAIVDYAQAYA